MEKILIHLRDLAIKLLEEKFKAFRAGFLAGSVVSLPFLFSVQGLPRYIMLLFPLKLFMCMCFSFCTGLASHGAKTTWSFIMRRMSSRNSKRKQKNNNNQNGKAA